MFYRAVPGLFRMPYVLYNGFFVLNFSDFMFNPETKLQFILIVNRILAWHLFYLMIVGLVVKFDKTGT